MEKLYYKFHEINRNLYAMNYVLPANVTNVEVVKVFPVNDGKRLKLYQLKIDVNEQDVDQKVTMILKRGVTFSTEKDAKIALLKCRHYLNKPMNEIDAYAQKLHLYAVELRKILKSGGPTNLSEIPPFPRFESVSSVEVMNFLENLHQR